MPGLSSQGRHLDLNSKRGWPHWTERNEAGPDLMQTKSTAWFSPE